MPAISASTCRCSGDRSAPRRPLPTCQSDVCSSFIRGSRYGEGLTAARDPTATSWASSFVTATWVPSFPAPWIEGPDRAWRGLGGDTEAMAGTLGDLLTAWAGDDPGGVVALERHGLRRTLTIGQLVAGSEARAAGLAGLGAGPERAVVVWLPNRLEWLEVVVAAARIGTPVVGLNPRYRSEELRHVLARSHAAVLVTVDGFAGTGYAEI